VLLEFILTGGPVSWECFGLVRVSYPVAQERCVSPVVSLRTFASHASLPVVVLLDMQREYPAKPQLLAICGSHNASGNCQRAPHRNRKATSRNEVSVRLARNEMATAIVSGVSAQVVETAGWVAAAASSRNPSSGKSADG
jgi:hypothetical protein